MDLIFILTVMAFGMIGGQVHKPARRFGVPILTVIYSIYNDIKDSKGSKVRNLIFLLLAPILIMGYGENSKLLKIFKKDWIVRIVYGVLISIPFGLFVLANDLNFFIYIICLASLVLAYSTKAGRLGHIGEFDFLIEDMIRFSVIGRLIILLTKGY